MGGLFGRSSSKDVAKERLRNVLVRDRSSTTPNFMDNLRDDLMRVLNEYVEVGQTGVDVKIQSVENQVALVANIPVKQVKRHRPGGQ